MSRILAHLPLTPPPPPPPQTPDMSTQKQRVVKKTSSFLSLRREKDRSINQATTFSHSPSTPTQPRPIKSKVRKPSPTRTDPSSHDSSTRRRTEREPVTAINNTFPFPNYSPSNDSDSFIGASQPTPYTRVRSKTGPSRRSNWADSPPIPQLRFSGSSTRTHFDTPPDTPVDNASIKGYQVVVAAPVSGVETMDALVDGMNGGDDIFSSSLQNRARFGIPGHHPLYQPPLPAPPPGIKLGGPKTRKHIQTRHPSNSDDDDDDDLPTPIPRPRRHRPPASETFRKASVHTIPDIPPALKPARPLFPNHVSAETIRGSLDSNPERPRTAPPSIDEIIRTHAPPQAQSRPRPVISRTSSVCASNVSHTAVLEDLESEPEPLSAEEEAEFLSRSSIDSVADEVRRTIRNQNSLRVASPSPPQQTYTTPNRHSVISDSASYQSPRSDNGTEKASLYSSSISYHQPASPIDTHSYKRPSRIAQSQIVAQYLRSPRLTTLLKLTRSPHASQDNPLVVSLSDLGSPTGFPLVVFLGLGCVRHIMGLYDEMAECLGLRLITIDRWGLGRTEPRSKSAKGIMQWAAVVEEVLDLLHIHQCSVMAHSAGAPYALSFANKLSKRIRGDICLLAPWVGGSEGAGGYKWLKYVPNGILKTAQAAEWKLQAWMIGKPPTIAFEGIGYNAQPASSPANMILMRNSPSSRSNGHLNPVYPSVDNRSSPSVASIDITEYDDLGDFDGRFESRSTLGGLEMPPKRMNDSKGTFTKRKVSRGFLERLKGSSNSQPQSPTEEKPATTGKKLKALRSMSSLRGKTSSPNNSAKRSAESSPKLPMPPPLGLELGLGFDQLSWPKLSDQGRLTPNPDRSTPDLTTRSGGNRSVSFTASQRQLPLSAPGSPARSSFNSSINGVSYQAALGSALIAASHAESSNGTHNDLLQILNHDNHPLGFSYTSFPHNVQVWYGDKDEKIAENAVRWMEQNMGQGQCHVKVVKGADHALMYNSSVVVEVLEYVSMHAGLWSVIFLIVFASLLKLEVKQISTSSHFFLHLLEYYFC